MTRKVTISMNTMGHLELTVSDRAKRELHLKSGDAYIQGEQDIDSFLDSLRRQSANTVREGFIVVVLMDDYEVEAYFNR